jgi:hypothetical protein
MLPDRIDATISSNRLAHLDIMTEPFLSLLLTGEKTVESRLSHRCFASYQRVSPGDLVLVAAPGPLVRGCFTVGDVYYFDLAQHSAALIERRFGARIVMRCPTSGRVGRRHPGG